MVLDFGLGMPPAAAAMGDHDLTVRSRAGGHAPGGFKFAAIMIESGPGPGGRVPGPAQDESRDWRGESD